MKVLICPLNWGLGHTTRCIPLIDQYIQQGHIVHIATDGIALKLLQERYPQLRFWHAPPTPFVIPRDFAGSETTVSVTRYKLKYISGTLLAKKTCKCRIYDLICPTIGLGCGILP